MGTESAVNYANLFMKTMDILIKNTAHTQYQETPKLQVQDQMNTMLVKQWENVVPTLWTTQTFTFTLTWTSKKLKSVCSKFNQIWSLLNQCLLFYLIIQMHFNIPYIFIYLFIHSKVYVAFWVY